MQCIPAKTGSLIMCKKYKSLYGTLMENSRFLLVILAKTLNKVDEIMSSVGFYLVAQKFREV